MDEIKILFFEPDVLKMVETIDATINKMFDIILGYEIYASVANDIIYFWIYVRMRVCAGSSWTVL